MGRDPWCEMLRSLWHVARLARYPPDAANHTWSVLYFASCICGIASRAALPDDGRDPNGALDTLDLTTDALSPREIEIARHYAEGATYHEIAAALGIAPSTVRTHLAAIYRKLGVSSKLELHARLDGDRPAPRDQTDHGAVISELALSLEEALAREKAVSEVLRIIGGARGDIDAVMPAILGYALRLCDAEYGGLFDYVGGGPLPACKRPVAPTLCLPSRAPRRAPDFQAETSAARGSGAPRRRAREDPHADHRDPERRPQARLPDHHHR
jgi:DNA-binding CsgD family transcriptional regulator